MSSYDTMQLEILLAIKIVLYLFKVYIQQLRSMKNIVHTSISTPLKIQT